MRVVAAATALLLLPAAAWAQNRVERKIEGSDKPVVAYTSNGGGAQPGLILALHGTGGSGPQFAGGFPIQQICSAGYVIVFPTSIQGAWGTQQTGGTPEGREKDETYIRAIVDSFVKEFNVHPDKIHFIGYSAGSMFSARVITSNALDGYRIRSFCGHSGGYTSKGRAREDRAKETSVWVLNGSRDTAHAEYSKNMHDMFKDAGYDAKYQVIDGAGHSFPLVPFPEILKWWQGLDKGAPDYTKIAGALKRGNDALERRQFGAAHKAFDEAKKAAEAKSDRMTKEADEG
ncbi:MAG TPA: dienelactone hydrolase family protein, partial [Planctomycetota bacterium]|nr:dienelactone hydrolase family protein [Planctomycetota bacterium]